MNKSFGPYRILAGQHTEDVAVCEAKIKKIDAQTAIAVVGGEEQMLQSDGQGARVVLDGQRYAAYQGNRKLTYSELREGQTYTLAQPVTFRPGCEPFMSSGARQADDAGRVTVVGLDAAFNRGPQSVKFQLVNQVDATEVDRLRARIAELEEQAKARPQPKNESDLEKMTLDQLKQWAADNEVVLKGNPKSREDVLRQLRQPA